MIKYVCTKTAKFSGEQYRVGSIVPVGKIDPVRVKQLINYGVLTAVGMPEEPESQDESNDKPDEKKPVEKKGKK